MNLRLAALFAVLAAFGAYSLWVMTQVGYFGIWQAGVANPGALQVLIDLCIVCTLASLWMIGDAPARGLSAWPFVAITLVAGSFGPMLYLAWRELRGSRLALA
ncbi:MAG TPA: DUF2834 domain-containing protein [Candidatus Binatia bacterium]|nr:DUF2834 domain-containing protein [Candidatus Binatia bacterium]